MAVGANGAPSLPPPYVAPTAPLSRADVAKRLGVSSRTVQRLEEARTLQPARDERGRLAFDAEDVERVARERRSAVEDAERDEAGELAAQVFALFNAGKGPRVVVSVARTSSRSSSGARVDLRVMWPQNNAMVGKPEMGKSRDFVFRMRVLRAESDAWTRAARAAGKRSVSAWAREVLNAASGRNAQPARPRGEG